MLDRCASYLGYYFQTLLKASIITNRSFCEPNRRPVIGNEMKSLFLSAWVLTISAVSVFAQAVKETPTPPVDGEVVKISTNLIRIDVSVTDAKGRTVTDLKQNEIEIFENGEKQRITSFSFVSPLRNVQLLKPVEKQEAAFPPPAVILRPADVRRTIALLVDDLSLSFESVAYTRRALKKFVDVQMQDGDLVAIVRTGAGVGALQQFTTDKRMLYAAIERIKWNPMGSGGVSAFAPIAPTLNETLKGAGDPLVTDADVQDEKNKIKSENDARNSKFAAGTLGAISYVVSGMTEMPGRKFAILFSDGFQLTVRDRWGDLVTF